MDFAHNDREDGSDSSEDSLDVVDNDERAHRQAVKRSRSTSGMEKRWRDQDREALDKAIKANAPPVIYDSRCAICKCEYRLWIERQLMHGASYVSIASSIPGVNIDTFRRSLSRHYKNHMDLEGAMVRASMEEESDLLQQNYEEGLKGAFTNKAALGILIRKGFSDALDNITTVEPKDMVKMMELYDKMDTSSATRMVEEAKTAVAIFMQAIRNVFSDNLDKELADSLSSSIVKEVKRLREQSEIESHVEDHMRRLPNASA